MQNKNSKLYLLVGAIIAALCLTFSSKCVKDETSDQEAISFLIMVDQHEIDTANVVMEKLKDPGIIAFAKSITADHTMNKEQTLKLSGQKGIKAKDTSNIIEFRENAQNARSLLASSTQTEVDYINLMVKDHEKVLAKLASFIEKVRDTDLKKFLELTKEQVESHLSKLRNFKKK